jgi:hypothetical protein
MKWQVIKFRVLKWLKRIVVYGLFGAIALAVIGFSVLQIPSVQKSLINRITGGFSKVSGFDIKFDRFYILWYDRLEITGLEVTDPKGNSMIEAGELFINFRIASVYQNKDINIDAVSLTGANVNLVTIPDSDTTLDLNINVFIAEINKQLASGKKGGRSPKINIGEVLVQQSTFSMNQTSQDSIKRGFDYKHFKVALDEGNLNNFKVIGDTIEFQVESLLIKDQKTDLTIHELSTFFRISQTSMEFKGLSLGFNKSHVSDTILFTYARQVDLNDFVNKVTIHANLKNTKLYPEDISFFTTGLERWKEPIQLTGRFNGKVSHFIFNPMEIVIGTSTIRGSLEMDGLPVIKETFINARLRPSTVYATDLDFVIPENIARNLTSLDNIRLKGNFTGFVNDFVAEGDFNTKFGQIQSDINYKIAEDIGQSSYKGRLKLINVELGKYLKDTVRFQRVNLNGQIEGHGFTRETADFILVGYIESIGLKGYEYSNIQSNARFAKQFFSGNLRINDPNLKFKMTGSIDLRQGKELIKIQANLDTALLHKLKLTKDVLFLQSYVDIDSRGLKLDSIVGTAVFRKTLVQYREDSIQIDSIRLVSQNENGDRELTLRSSMADLSLKGDFYYSSLFNDLQQLVQEFLLNIKNDPDELRAYYAAKNKTDQAYKAAINVELHNIDPIFKVLNIDAHTSPEMKIQGEFSNNITSNLHVFTKFDTLLINGQEFTDNEIEFSGSKVRDSTEVLAQLTINSAGQKLNKAVNTRNLFVETIWNKDHIDLDVDVDQVGYDNSVRLRSEIDFLTDSTKLKILPSVIKILGENWTINEGNYTLMKGRELSINHLGMKHEFQSILVNGFISQDPEKVLQININNFDLSFINFFSTEKFKGQLNAEFKQRDLYTHVFIENVLRIDSLTINNFLVGQVQGNNTRDPDTDRFNVDVTVDRFNSRIVDIKGYYDPKDRLNPLHTKAILEKANLKLLEPVVKDLFTQLDGTLTGVYDIQGTFTHPNISGAAKIQNGQLLINYLKTLYKVKGTLGITYDKIEFNDFELTDAFNNKGTLGGYIAHRSFGKMRLALEASFRNFQLLNTNARDNSLFYGTAYGTGNLAVIGPASNLKISASARTNKNTRISIPVGGTASLEKKDFIQFINFTDTVKTKANKTQLKKKELSGLTLNLDIDVTPDAYTEIIFDIKSGDIIRGRGRGDINLQIDTKGEFNMFGLVEFTEGAYNFTLYDIINKEFTIKPGSRITWFGDPYEGNLNITASYRQLTSIGPVLRDPTLANANDPNIKRKYPIEVLLKLDGPMLSPQIGFDIDAINLPDVVNVVDNGNSRQAFPRQDFAAFKAKLDEQEMKRQVFSLIILRKLSPPDAFATGGSLYNSVSELLSNQLSYWLSQVDQNLEIDLDLGTLDQEAFNTFQLRLSYSFLNGRLRVTRDGSFGNQTNRSELSTIAGDWTVDYLLTPDGKFKVKMFSRSSINQLQTSLNSQSTAAVTTGVSLLYTQNFNEFKDLLRSARERRRRELEQHPPEEEPDAPLKQNN